jgi:hypothetical protein
MTKTTLKALWVGGGGVLATWLAVTPNQGVPTSEAPAPRPKAISDPRADMLSAQAEKLRARANAAGLRPSTRDPFRFAAANRPARAGRPGNVVAEPSAAAVAPTPPPPSLTLSGIAEKNTPDGVQRTAVITADGQIYLVKNGDSVAGLYTVATIEPDAVVLRDLAGAADLRLILR